MRVVTGEAKGRKLKGPKTIGTRPIIDRVKQALFNIIAARVEDAISSPGRAASVSRL